MSDTNPEEQINLPREVPKGHPLTDITIDDLPQHDPPTEIMEPAREMLKDKPLTLESFESNAQNDKPQEVQDPASVVEGTSK